ncbi:histidine phosphatase family protein [Chachezhania sediminis]|uniref:histidine phosphatase family protein n=1 Tax=Chachezhania sediminis TaxID=2599291 RepID=UPI00131BBFFC|nr:histidine phosphatase family protein [Chachezhania sediminis]
MTARAAFLRHGAYAQAKGAPSAWQPYPLTDEGRGHAADGGGELARYLGDGGLSLDPVIHCSTLLRAWQTAEIVADTLVAAGLDVTEIRQTDALTERSVGSAANLTLEQIEAVLAADPRFGPPPAGWKADPDYCLPLPGAESLAEAGRRVADHVRGTVSHASCVTLYVGHGAAFRHASCHLGALTAAEVPLLSMFHGRPVVLEDHPSGQWRHAGGEWKQRRSEAPD